MFVDLLNWLLIVLAIFYFTALLLLWLGMQRNRAGTAVEQPMVSVVIAARNEAHHMPALVQALAAQDYPVEKIEFILVDDRSTDDTGAAFRHSVGTDSRFRLERVLQVNPEMAGKKNALAIGIQAARGALILTTDADCRPLSHWVSTVVAFFEPKVGLVAGFSPLELPDTRSLAHRLIALDALALACVAAGSAGWGRLATCSGRNLAYRKVVFDQVGGFSGIGHFVSGDDDLLLHLVQQQTRWHIRYALDQRALVPSFLPASLRAFYHQRIRHASKGRHYGWKMTTILTVIYLFNLLIFILIPALLMGEWNPIPAFILLIKSALELVVLASGAQKFAKIHLLKTFLLAELLHIPYVVIFGALGQFGKFSWKQENWDARISRRKI